MVVIKFIAPNKLLIPAKCKANIARSTLGPLWLCIPDKGGYKVHPVPAPFSITLANINNTKLGGSNQKLMLFNLGNHLTKVVSYLYGLCLHPYNYGTSRLVSEDPTHNIIIIILVSCIFFLCVHKCYY